MSVPKRAQPLVKKSAIVSPKLSTQTFRTARSQEPAPSKHLTAQPVVSVPDRVVVYDPNSAEIAELKKYIYQNETRLNLEERAMVSALKPLQVRHGECDKCSGCEAFEQALEAQLEPLKASQQTINTGRGYVRDARDRLRELLGPTRYPREINSYFEEEDYRRSEGVDV